jgi:glycerol-3-phosphate cytidylyltransferase/D-beta-D-heptose 7-phosphate kinase/D-beta-D-heptose 1-phosphate adenosyltransferase
MGQPRAASLVSGYFGPLHDGHLDLFEAARARHGYLIVIVNNDVQQRLKKGRVIQGEQNRLRLVRALRVVDEALLATDEGPGIDRTFDVVRARHPGWDLEFCNGGDRSSVETLPAAERESARRNGIALRYGVGGTEKADSSSRILQALDEPGTR